MQQYASGHWYWYWKARAALFVRSVNEMCAYVCVGVCVGVIYLYVIVPAWNSSHGKFGKDVQYLTDP